MGSIVLLRFRLVYGLIQIVLLHYITVNAEYSLYTDVIVKVVIGCVNACAIIDDNILGLKMVHRLMDYSSMWSIDFSIM